MEQKRTLWIIAAVGVFLLVVLGAALILYSPAAHSTQTVAAIAPVKRPAANGWVSAPAVPAEQQHSEDQSAAKTEAPQEQQLSAAPSAADGVARVGDMTVISQNTTVYGLEKKSPAAGDADGGRFHDNRPEYAQNSSRRAEHGRSRSRTERKSDRTGERTRYCARTCKNARKSVCKKN
jgi:hypothetical protein